MGNFVCKPSNTDHHQEVNAGGKVQPFSSCKKNHKIIKQTWKKISGNKIENGVLVFYK